MLEGNLPSANVLCYQPVSAFHYKQRDISHLAVGSLDYFYRLYYRATQGIRSRAIFVKGREKHIKMSDNAYCEEQREEQTELEEAGGAEVRCFNIGIVFFSALCIYIFRGVATQVLIF